jgi:hypothetical protein
MFPSAKWLNNIKENFSLRTSTNMILMEMSLCLLEAQKENRSVWLLRLHYQIIRGSTLVDFIRSKVREISKEEMVQGTEV